MKHDKSLEYLVSMVEAVLPKTVEEINSVANRPYWGTVNVGEAFERIFSGFANEMGFENDCVGKAGSVVDIEVLSHSMLIQSKTTHPKTKNPKSSFQFCRTSAKTPDAAVSNVRTKFFEAFAGALVKNFYLLHHDFKAQKTTIYLLASKTDRVKFHGKFLNGQHGSMSKDYLMVPKSDLMKVWEKFW